MKLLAVLAAMLAFSGPKGWHASLEEGVAAAKKSGKPVLVVTAWTDRE
jgi:hypothetical protein